MLSTVSAHRTVLLGELALECEHFQNPRTITGLGDKSVTSLAESIKKDGIVDPPTVQRVRLSDGKIIDLTIDGQRRVLAGLEALPKNTPIPVVDLSDEIVDMSPVVGDMLIDKALTSLRREGLSSYELVGVAVKKRAAGKSLEEIGEKLDRSKSWVSRMLSAWDKASDKLKLEWRKGKLTDEQFKDLAEVTDPEKQIDKAKEVISARESGDKTEARVLAKETKETARKERDAKKSSSNGTTNGVNHTAPAKPKAKGEWYREQRELFSDEKAASKATENPKFVEPPAPKPPKPPSKIVIEEMLSMADKRPPTADLVKGIFLGVKFSQGLIEPDAFGKAWVQYVSRIEGRPRPVKARKPAKAKRPAKKVAKKAKR